MALKKVFRVTLHVDPATLHDIMLMGGKGVEVVDVQPVRHGGEDEAGALKGVQTGREFLLAYATARGGQFAIKEACDEAARQGLNPDAVRQQGSYLTKLGDLKRVDQGVYTLANAPSKSRKSNLNGHLVTGAGADIVMKLVAKGDIHVNEIKEAFKAAKMSPHSTNNLLAKMTRSGQIKRTEARGTYAKGA